MKPANTKKKPSITVSKTVKKVAPQVKKVVVPQPIIHQKFSHNHHPNDDLYICINDISLKRRYLLQSLKSSLVLQEEHERVMELRTRKLEILVEIKKEMESVNAKYQSLRKLVPNVKNIISYTEKELNELDGQIEVLKKEVKVKNREIDIDQRSAESLALGMKLSKSKKGNELGLVKHSPVQEEVVEVPKKKLTKLDRIQNNLKLIESKLNNI